MQKILILGGGFAAISLAKKLGPLCKKDPNIQVSMVSENNYFVFQPMLPEVAAGTLEASHIINPIRRTCKYVTFHRAKVDEIDTIKQTVKIVGRDITRPQTLEYDHLIFAMGLSVDQSRIPGMAEHTLPMKTLGDAFFLRNEIINKLEEAAIEKDPIYKQKLLTFVFVGGGFSGVETIGEVGDLIKQAVKGYPNISFKDVRLILIQSGNRILKELGEKIARFAEKKLKNRHIEIFLNTRVSEVTPEQITLNNGETIETKTVVSTTGNAPHEVITKLPFTNSKGRLDTNTKFQVVRRDQNGTIVETFPNIWAIGDCAFIPDITKPNVPEQGQPLCPPTAQHAVRQGKVCAANIWSSLHNKPMKQYKYKQMGQLAAIGHLTGVAEVFGIRFSGLIAFMLWRFIYWTKLPGIYCKCRVALDWLISLFFPVDITQIDVYRTEKVDRSHYQKGSYIFRQGDIADYFYIIESGQVEIVREHPDHTESIISVLKPGDSFGEMGLMQKAPRSASARCLNPVGLLKVGRNDFKALTGSYSDLKQQLESKIHNIQLRNKQLYGEEYDNLIKDSQLIKQDKTQVRVETINQAILDFENIDSNTQEKETKEPEPISPIKSEPKKKPRSYIEHGDYAQSEGHLDSALEYYQKALKSKRKDPSLLSKIGDIHIRLKNIKAALSIFEDALKMSPDDPFIIANLAHCYTNQKRHKEADNLLKSGLKNQPNHVELLNKLSESFIGQGYYKNAEKLLIFALRKDPNHVSSLISLAKCKIKSDENSLAMRILKKALNQTPTEVEKEELTGYLQTVHKKLSQSKIKK